MDAASPSIKETKPQPRKFDVRLALAAEAGHVAARDPDRVAGAACLPRLGRTHPHPAGEPNTRAAVYRNGCRAFWHTADSVNG